LRDQIVTDIGVESRKKHTYDGVRLPITTFEEIILNKTNGMRLHFWFIV